MVTSPHYPNYYPDEDRECKYLIDPETAGVQIVTLEVLDVDLEGANCECRPYSVPYLNYFSGRRL